MPRGKKATDTPTQSRYWVFTINNPIDTDAPEHWLFEQDINYLVYQEEIGAENTHHYQGYVEFTKLMRLTALKKLSPRAHWEGRRGTRAECIAYCTKLETRKDGTEPYIFQKPGKIDEEGKKDKSNKFDALRESIKNGASIKEIAETNFTAFLRYHRGLQLYETSILTPRNFKTLCIAIYGPTGTGKSSFNKKFFPDAYWKPKNMWWDEYSQQDVVAIDEFYGWFPYDYMLRLCDRYPSLVECKGGAKQFNSSIISFTSNKAPLNWYDNTKHSQEPLMRRLDIIWEFKEDAVLVHKGPNPTEFVEFLKANGIKQTRDKYSGRTDTIICEEIKELLAEDKHEERDFETQDVLDAIQDLGGIINNDIIADD